MSTNLVKQTSVISVDFSSVANAGVGISQSWIEKCLMEHGKAYVLKRANGHCEACKKAAPFLRKDGTPYLEPHHIKRVADGGPDHPRFVGAVCPTCHRIIHHGEGGVKLNAELEQYVLDLEKTQDTSTSIVLA
jgi:hypothetical protein